MQVVFDDKIVTKDDYTSDIKVSSKCMPMDFWNARLCGTDYSNLCEMLKSTYGSDYDKGAYCAREVLHHLCLYEGGVYASSAVSFIRELYGIYLD